MAHDLEYERIVRDDDRDVTTKPRSVLAGPVGVRHGVQVENRARDQVTVMTLLTKIQVSAGGALSALGAVEFPAPSDGTSTRMLADFIARFQRLNKLTVDGAVDVHGASLAKMQELAAHPKPTGGRSIGRVLAGADTGLAIRKVDAALAKLRAFRGEILLRIGPIVRPGKFDPVTEAALSTHFRLAAFGSGLIAPKRAVTLADIDLITATYNRLRVVLARGVKAFEDGTPRDKNGTIVAAAAFLNSSKIIFSFRYRNYTGPDGAAIGPNSRAAILIHEGTHAVDISGKSGDDDVHISEFSPTYATQSADKSLLNPSSYAGFAAHVFKGSDPQPPFGLHPVGRFL